LPPPLELIDRLCRQLLDLGVPRGDRRQIEAAILFIDLRGLTDMSARLGEAGPPSRRWEGLAHWTRTTGSMARSNSS
jgi:hypothetical protein